MNMETGFSNYSFAFCKLNDVPPSNDPADRWVRAWNSNDRCQPALPSAPHPTFEIVQTFQTKFGGQQPVSPVFAPERPQVLSFLRSANPVDARPVAFRPLKTERRCQTRRRHINRSDSHIKLLIEPCGTASTSELVELEWKQAEDFFVYQVCGESWLLQVHYGTQENKSRTNTSGQKNAESALELSVASWKPSTARAVCGFGLSCL